MQEATSQRCFSHINLSISPPLSIPPTLSKSQRKIYPWMGINNKKIWRQKILTPFPVIVFTFSKPRLNHGVRKTHHSSCYWSLKIIICTALKGMSDRFQENKLICFLVWEIIIGKYSALYMFCYSLCSDCFIVFSGFGIFLCCCCFVLF